MAELPERPSPEALRMPGAAGTAHKAFGGPIHPEVKKALDRIMATEQAPVKKAGGGAAAQSTGAAGSATPTPALATSAVPAVGATGVDPIALAEQLYSLGPGTQNEQMQANPQEQATANAYKSLPNLNLPDNPQDIGAKQASPISASGLAAQSKKGGLMRKKKAAGGVSNDEGENQLIESAETSGNQGLSSGAGQSISNLPPQTSAANVYTAPQATRDPSLQLSANPMLGNSPYSNIPSYNGFSPDLGPLSFGHSYQAPESTASATAGVNNYEANAAHQASNTKLPTYDFWNNPTAGQEQITPTVSTFSGSNGQYQAPPSLPAVSPGPVQTAAGPPTSIGGSAASKPLGTPLTINGQTDYMSPSGTLVNAQGQTVPYSFQEGGKITKLMRKKNAK